MLDLHLSRIFFIICCVVSPIASFNNDEYDGTAILNVEHSFDSGTAAQFTHRGSITIRSLKSNVATFTGTVPASFVSQLRTAAEGDGIYRIRVPIEMGSSGGAASVRDEYVTAFIPACALYESGLSDIITLHVDQAGSILGVAITTKPAVCSGRIVSTAGLGHYNTTVEIMQTVTGPAPETQAYLEKLAREKAEKEQGEKGDNRSFFAKYWMYIVPVVIFMMISSAANPEAAGGGGGR